MEEIIKKLKSYMAKVDNRAFMNRLLIVLVASVFLLIILNKLTDKKDIQENPILQEDIGNYNKKGSIDYADMLEKKLENILIRLKGVEKAHVMITLEDSIERIPASNTTTSIETTEEKDSQGGERKTKREEETSQLVNLSDDVVILREVKPNIKGVIVIAEGAENGEVLERIYEAVKTVLGIASNRIEVFPGK